MYATDNSSAYVGGSSATTSASSLSVSDVLQTLRRYWLFPVIGCLLGSLAGLTYMLMFPEPYRSSSRILIDRSVNRYLHANKLVDEPMGEEMDNGSQIHIISSESIVLPVVKALDLTNDPEFVGTDTSGTAPDPWSLRGIVRSTRTALGLRAPGLDAELQRERRAVEAVMKRLSVLREDVPNVINVTFSSEDPRKAAKISNAISDAYIAANLEAKKNSVRLATQLLNQRTAELKIQAEEADKALQDFKIENKIAGTGRGNQSTERLFQLNSELTNARIALAEAKARVDRAQDRMPDGTAPRMKTADDDVTAKMRAQMIELSTKLSEIEGRVGRSHDAAAKMRKRVDDFRAAINFEEHRLASTYRSEYSLAKARVDELMSTIASAVAGADDISKSHAKMRDLESSAETLRNLYNASLHRLNESNKAQSQTLSTQDARVISQAAPPLSKNFKKPLLAFGAAAALGLLLGLGSAVGAEVAASMFRSPGQVRAFADYYCAVLPNIETARDRKLEEYVLEAPYSRFAETIRTIRASVVSEYDGPRGTVVGVISSITGEGKSTIAANLATLVAASKLTRTLLIDADFRDRRLTNELAPGRREGLIEALDDAGRLKQLVVRRESSGLDILPCVFSSSVPNAAEMLGSPNMGRLLDAARDNYDLVVIEIPAILSYADFKMAERFVDQFVFVVEWGATRRRAFGDALAESERIRDRIACTVLNRADQATLQSLDRQERSRLGTRSSS